MTTKQIIEQMESVMLDLIVECDLNIGQPRRPMIRKTLRTLLESFGEEIIGKDADMSDNNWDKLNHIHKSCERGNGCVCQELNDLRAEQRLKMKEIINQIGK